MEKAAAIENSRVLFQLIRNTGPRKPKVSEVICEKDGTLIHSQHRRLHRWSEHFQEQFSWPEFAALFSNDNLNPEWDVNISPPTVAEITSELQLLKRNKAAGPNGLSPTLFKDGDEALAIALTRLLALIWESEEVPSEWCSALIIPVYKKGERTSCENYRGISLVNIASKLLTGIILRRLTNVREKRIRGKPSRISSRSGMHRSHLHFTSNFRT